MDNEKIYKILKKTPIKVPNYPFIDYVLENEKYEIFAVDLIFRYGIMVGKQEERKKRNKKTVGKKLGEYVTSVANDLTVSQYVAICNALGVSLDAFR